MTTETEAARADRLAFCKLSDDLDDARHEYAAAQGEDYGKPDYANANEYRDEGFALGQDAFDLPEEDREDYIWTQVFAYPDHARYLVECAAEYRLFELVREDNRYPFNAEYAVEVAA